jgi:nitrite reductase (NADH) large subunit
MQYYREQAKYQERTYDFVERVGIDHLKRVLVDDAEGIAEELDERMQASVEAYVDPWEEAKKPVHPTQFAASLPQKKKRLRDWVLSLNPLRKVG